jgi:hypothetical protein
LLANVVVGRDVMIAALFGDEFDQLKKALAETGAATPSEGEPDSRSSSAPAPQWDGLSTTSIEPLSGNSPQPARAGNGHTVPTTSDHQQ